ncbi:ABC transporter ATP-binding protein [Micromonospora profundi]|uniref:ABC transporter ATP-binding protein n=1 Tax=Micromonospora profundi TaxID=1420889 RepID=UPI0036482890
MSISNTPQATPGTSSLLQVDGLRRHFALPRGRMLRAVDGVSLRIDSGRTLALVGESGSGKSTLGRCVVRMDEPTDGQIRFDGEDITHLRHRDLRTIRQRMQMVFQSPYTSLSPRMSVGASIAEPLQIHGLPDGLSPADRVREVLDMVGLPASVETRRPSQLSGGQRQRIGLARALALSPKMLVADEPTASLDLTSQAQIVNLLLELQSRLSLAMLFITHDLGLAHHLSHECAVMYLGRIVEAGPTVELMRQPLHPYTHLLVSTRSRGPAAPAEAESVPSPINPPAGCHFRSRCPIAVDKCATEYPPLQATPSGRRVACHRPGVLELSGTATARIPQPETWPRPPVATAAPSTTALTSSPNPSAGASHD